MEQLMDGLRLVQFREPPAYLEAIKSYDDSFMAYSTCSIQDLVKQMSEDQSSTVSFYLLAVYRGDDLL